MRTGKTVLALDLALQFAAQGKSVAWVSTIRTTDEARLLVRVVAPAAPHTPAEARISWWNIAPPADVPSGVALGSLAHAAWTLRMLEGTLRPDDTTAPPAIDLLVLDSIPEPHDLPGFAAFCTRSFAEALHFWASARGTSLCVILDAPPERASQLVRNWTAANDVTVCCYTSDRYDVEGGPTIHGAKVISARRPIAARGTCEFYIMDGEGLVLRAAPGQTIANPVRRWGLLDGPSPNAPAVDVVDP
jgi:hypothetical protein